MFNKRLVITVAVVFVCLMIGSFAVSVGGDRGTAQAVNPTQAATQTQEKYIVKEYNGKVAAFKFGESKPFDTTQQNVDELPQRDRELLKSGIEVNGSDRLRRLLED